MLKNKLNLTAVAFSFVFVSILIQIAHSRPINSELFSDDEKVEKKKLPVARYYRSRDYDTIHMALNLRFDWEKEQTYGTNTITLAPLVSNLKIVSLDAGLMKFNSVMLKSGKSLVYSFDEKAQRLNVTLDRIYKINEQITLVIDYRTNGGVVPTELGFGAGGGLKFIKPTADNPKIPKQIWSQGESEYNHFWFPGYDSPNDFRTTELTATVEKPLMVISNGKLIETKANKDGTQTFHWKMDTPYSNYLTSIVVGEYVEVKGKYLDVPVSTFVYKDILKEGISTTKRLPDMVKFFSEKTGVKYPYPKYAQTIGYEFNGGMENISATTQTDSMIVDERTMLDQDEDSLQSHELAHQWFGDYVTCRDWSEIWLNESFATYMQALWTNEYAGKDEFLYSDIRSNQQQYYGAWAQGSRRPIVTKNYDNPDSVFDTYAYPRGGAVLHMLKKQLGDDNWWRSINHYLTKNANKPVQTEDLRIAIEETTGQTMDAFFDQWVYKMGHPVFEVSKTFDEATKKLTLDVKQTQKRDETSDYPQVTFFQTPVDIEIGTASGTKVETVFIDAKAENTFTFNIDSKPLLVDFDNEGTLIKELKFEKSTDELIYQMANDKDVLGRLWALNQLKPKMNNEAEKAKISAAIIGEITNDSFWGLRRDAINAFAPAQGNRGPVAPNPNAPIIKFDQTLLTALTTSTKDKDSKVRANAFRALGTQKDISMAESFIACFSDQSYGVIDACSAALANTKSDKAYDVLVNLAKQASWKNRVKNAAVRGLGTLGDKRAFELILETFKEALNDNQIQSMFNGLQSFIRLGDPRGQEAFDLAKKKFANDPQFIGFITQSETQFKAAIKK
jgi:aminopeptidase N